MRDVKGGRWPERNAGWVRSSITIQRRRKRLHRPPGGGLLFDLFARFLCRLFDRRYSLPADPLFHEIPGMVGAFAEIQFASIFLRIFKGLELGRDLHLPKGSDFIRLLRN